jgi:hypothetical protein
VFLALADQRLKNVEEARNATTKAREALPKSKPDAVWDRAEVELLRAELDAVVPPPRE